MKDIVIAAGYATRLGELTKNFPKPLLKIGERSILDRMLDDIDTIPEIDEHIIITNHKFAPIFEKWKKENIRCKKPISIVDDGTETELIADFGTIYEDRSSGSAEWKKVDGNSDPLKGSTWTLTKYSDAARTSPVSSWTIEDNNFSWTTTCTEDTSVKCDTDNTDGTIKIEKLDWGYYRIVESKAPTGYMKVEKEWDFEIDATDPAKTNVVNPDAFVNYKERGDLPLTGAWFTPANLIRFGAITLGAGAALWLSRTAWRRFRDDGTWRTDR